MNFRRIALWGTILILIAAGLAYAFRPQPVPVDLIAAKKAPLVVTINEEGETRIRDVFTMSSPVAGRSQRIELDVGDRVEAQQTVITRIAPIDPEILDVRSQIRAKIAVRAAKAARDYAIAELDSARATMEFARTELERAKVPQQPEDPVAQRPGGSLPQLQNPRRGSQGRRGGAEDE